MEAFFNVLFEVSNEDRYKILLRLVDEPMNVTQLSKILGLSLTETSRHLSRIEEVGLAIKTPVGSYEITPFGRLSLNQLQVLEFTSKHRDYFNHHSLTHLPKEFVDRIGDLKESSYNDDVMVVFSIMKRVIEEAEESIWAIIDQYPMSIVSSARDSIRRKVRFESIEPEDWVPPTELSEEISDVERTWAFEARKYGFYDPRVLKGNVDVFLYMSEKEVALLAFPTLNGKFDYKGFNTTDETAKKWCRDLFQYYWEKARKKNLIDV